jgi:RNA polymerase sigma factor (sigma-70 family)
MTSAPSTNVVLRHIRELAAVEGAARLPDGQLLERFVARHDDSAFEALLRRHGPLVLGVCRRVLSEAHDVEDAFQATFLVLARKAATVGRRAALGTWLYQVAYHTAQRARKRAAARRRREDRAPPREQPDPLAEVTGRELLAVLDEELHRLPERLRAPLVLCYLEGKTRDEAARDLGWSLGTLKRRLEGGRAVLHARLSGRGLALAGMLAAGLGVVAVPPALAAVTTAAALLVAAGNEAAVAAPVLRLMSDALRAITAGPRKAVGALLVIVTLIAAGAGLLTHRSPAAAGADPPAPVAEAPKARPDADREEMTVRGRVLADGKPVADAEVAVVARGWSFAAKDYQALTKGTTDTDGRFRLTVPRLSSGEGFVLARKAGHALAQQPLNLAAGQQEMTLALPPEQPLRGRLHDLQGQPAAGVKVTVLRIGGRFDDVLNNPPEGVPLWPKAVTSDAEGRFTIAGLPRNQEAQLLVPGDDRFAWQALRLPPDNGDKAMTWTLAPGHLLEGLVVYEDTGKPAAGARVAVRPADIRGHTDKDGHFQVNLPAVDQDRLPPLLVYPGEGEPYLPVRQQVTWPRGAVKHRIEVKLPRGVRVRGTVTEADGRKPVAGAAVLFVPREGDNTKRSPNVLTAWDDMTASGGDGTFRLVAPAGPGHLLVGGPGLDFIHEEVAEGALLVGKPVGSRLYPDGLVKLDLSPAADPKEVTVPLRRGVTVRGRVLDPQGKPVARALMLCRLFRSVVPLSGFTAEVRDGLFALHGCDPGQDYPVYFLDPENGWGASVSLSGKQAGGDPVTVRLAPCGRATARLVDDAGKPLKDYLPRGGLLRIVVTPGPPFHEAARKGVVAADEVFAAILLSHKQRGEQKGLTTDAEGRFTYSNLIPGASYRIEVVGKEGPVVRKEFQALADKTIDLGDVAVE